MIALLNQLPLVVDPSGGVFGFRQEWLESRLRLAARRAGYKDWWIARDLSACTRLYLEKYAELNTIALDGLEELVRQALRDMGYEEVAAAFTSKPFQLTLCL